METNKQTKLERQQLQKQTKNLWLLELADQSRQLKNYNSEISIQISGNLSFHVFYLFYMGNKFIESLLQKYHTSYGSTIFQTSLTHPLRISY